MVFLLWFYLCNVVPLILQAAIPVDAVTATPSLYFSCNWSIMAGSYCMPINIQQQKKGKLVRKVLPRNSTDLPVPSERGRKGRAQ